MADGGVSRPADSLLSSHVRIASQDGVLLAGEESGNGLDDVTHVLAAPVVSGESPPVLQVPNTVLDPDTPRGVGLAPAFMHFFVPLGRVPLALAMRWRDHAPAGLGAEALVAASARLGLRCRGSQNVQAATMLGNTPLGGLAQVVPEMPSVRDLDRLRRSGGGALGEERCSVPADHLGAWPLGESGRRTGCLSVREEINGTAGFDVHQDSAVVAALAGCVLVDTAHPRRRHVRLGKRVDQAPDRAPAHGHAEDGGRPGRDRVRPGSSAVVPCADRTGGSGRISAPRRSGAGTWCSGSGTAGREVAAQPFARRSARRRENAGRNYERGSIRPHTPGRLLQMEHDLFHGPELSAQLP